MVETIYFGVSIYFTIFIKSLYFITYSLFNLYFTRCNFASIKKAMNTLLSTIIHAFTNLAAINANCKTWLTAIIMITIVVLLTTYINSKEKDKGGKE